MADQKKNKIIKAAIFDVAALILDSFSLYQLMFSDNIGSLATAFLATILFLSVPLFVYVNYQAFMKQEKHSGVMNVNDLDTKEEFTAAFQPYFSDPFLRKFVESAIRQLSALEKKTATIEQILLQNFSQGLEEFDVVNQVVQDSKEAVYSNLREFLNRMTILQGGYAYSAGTGQIAEEQKKMRETHVNFMISVLNNNEIIFLELDKLMIEITKMSASESNPEKRIAKIRDIVSSLQRLHEADSSEYDKIAEAYDSVSVPELSGVGGREYGQ